MTDNKAARATVAYLIVRDQAHENAYAKALESPASVGGGTLTAEFSPEGFPRTSRSSARRSSRPVSTRTC